MPEISFKAWAVTNNVKQAEIADLLGISYTAVNAKLNGRSMWSLPQIKKICTKYNISADIFLNESCEKATRS